MARLILGVIVGFALWSLIWLGGNMGIAGVAPGAFAEDGRVTQQWVFGAMLVLSVVASFLSGRAAGVIAGTRRRGAGKTLGIVLLLVGIAVQALGWELAPLWYHVVFLALLFPVSLMGAGKVRAIGGGTPAGNAATNM